MISIGAQGFLAEPSIATNPTDPNHLVVIATSLSKQNCVLPNCKVDLGFYTSRDAGLTWASPVSFNRSQDVLHNGQVAFDPEGNLIILGVRNDVIILNSATAGDDYLPSRSNIQEVTRAQVLARPWLQIDPETSILFLSFDAQEDDFRFVTPAFITSQDGVFWSTTARADQHISASDIMSPRATGPDDIRVLFGEGENVSMVWVWDSEPWTWPRTVWMANSTDGGISFGPPTAILETWGPINTASRNGQFAIVYRSGTEESQQLAVAVSADSGRIWTSTVASGQVPLYFDVRTAPGIDISPLGTIDLVFYAHDPNAVECVLDTERWRLSLPFGGVDNCEYDVFYTYSEDGGSSYSEPVQLNSAPIRGEDFIRFNEASYASSHLGMASSENFAWPSWIGTPQLGVTQINSAQIER